MSNGDNGNMLIDAGSGHSGFVNDIELIDLRAVAAALAPEESEEMSPAG